MILNNSLTWIAWPAFINFTLIMKLFRGNAFLSTLVKLVARSETPAGSSTALNMVNIIKVLWDSIKYTSGLTNTLDKTFSILKLNKYNLVWALNYWW